MQNRHRHRRSLFALLLLACSVHASAGDVAPPPSPSPSQNSGLVGSWLGTLDLGSLKLRLALDVTDRDGKRTATVISVDQSAAEIPVTTLTEADGTVHLELNRIRASFDGTFRAAGAELAGSWTQGGRSLPLVFQRQDKPFTLSRPQEPKKPYPYREEEVTFPNERAGITLAGTITLPPGDGPFPAVVLITGSGPQDRDEALMGHKPFLVLADHLTRAGIAVLRYDDRGVAGSKGNFSKATIHDFASDARAAFDFLKVHTGIDPKRVGMLGHSEGSIHAPLAAEHEPDVAFMVFLAGVGIPMNELLERQQNDLLKLRGIDYVITPEVRAISDAVNERIRTLPDDPETPAFIRAKVKESVALMPENLRQALGLTDAAVEAQIQTILSPWFMSLAVYDPKPALMELRCPLLALNGDKDSQVSADENLAGIKAALEAGGNRDVTVRKFPGLNHLFQHCTTGAPAEYGTIEETMAPEVLDTVAQWILAQPAAAKM